MRVDPNKVTIQIVRNGEIIPYVHDVREMLSAEVPMSTVVEDAIQPRTYFDENDQERLDESLDEVGQVESVIAILIHAGPDNAKPRWKIQSGGRRYRSNRRRGIETIWITYKPDVTEETLLLHSLVSNVCKAGHTRSEIAKAIDRLLKENQLTHAQISRALGHSEDWVKEHHSLLMLTHRLLPLLDKPTPEHERMPLGVGIKLALLESSEQERLWEFIKKLPKSRMLAKLQELGAQGKVNRRGLGGSALSAKKLLQNGLEKVGRQFDPILELSPDFWNNTVAYAITLYRFRSTKALLLQVLTRRCFLRTFVHFS